MTQELEQRVAGKRIVVGLSGGVDSAVAALLLTRAGADVEALYMTNWEDDDGYCTAAQDLQDARQVADRIGITFHSVNFARQYRDQVFEYFLDEYRAGRTPNPDVLCNREIKFGVFREYAHRLGAEMLATGHYARSASIEGLGALFKGRDNNKDQSYFLHAVDAGALRETVFPLGELDKNEVRDIARDAGLPVYDKKDSTGICFIGERPFREFLSTYLPANPGPIRTLGGNVVGEHQGLMYYTLGQRQGLSIGGQRNRRELPWYVIDKDLNDNALIVAQGEHERLFSSQLRATKPDWIGASPTAIDDGFRCRAKVRYRQQDQDCVVTEDGEALTVTFDTPQRAVAPGQFVVFYEADRCLGGATIDQIH